MTARGPDELDRAGLRRFARALTGETRSGDTLADGVAWPRVAGHDFAAARTHAYRALLHRHAAGPAATPPPERMAVLLVDLAGLPEAEAARVLEIDAPDLSALIARGRRAVDREPRAGILIVHAGGAEVVDDVTEMLECRGHRVVGHAWSEADALRRLGNEPPDLILVLDRSLACALAGSSLVTDPRHSGDPPLVLVAALPEAHLTGERPEPAFVASKPFTAAHLLAVVAQALACAPPRALHPQARREGRP